MCLLPPTLPLHHACNVASNEAEAPGFGYEQVRDSGFGYEQVGDFPNPKKWVGWTQNASLCTPRPVPARSAHFPRKF